jgi:hypothetical protein
MKKHLLIFALFTSSLSLMAQPVILRSNMAPIGFHSSFSIGATMDPGPAGANQTWDFSGIALTEAGTFALVDPATTPWVAQVGTSNYCYKVTPTGSEAIYDYYDLQTSQMPKMAQGMNSTGGEIFTDPKIDLKFPFNFGDSYFDEFAKTNGGTGNVTKTYDGYGTLITPDKTYHNVVRIHTVWDDLEWDYTWWDSESVHMIWSVTPEMVRALSNENTAIGDNTAAPNTFTLTPNPAKSFFSISGSKAAIKEVQVLALTGQVKKTFAGKQDKYDVGSLESGIYLILIEPVTGSIVTKRLVVE